MLIFLFCVYLLNLFLYLGMGLDSSSLFYRGLGMGRLAKKGKPYVTLGTFFYFIVFFHFYKLSHKM